jgi:hypothetical protein
MRNSGVELRGTRWGFMPLPHEARWRSGSDSHLLSTWPVTTRISAIFKPTPFSRVSSPRTTMDHHDRFPADRWFRSDGDVTYRIVSHTVRLSMSIDRPPAWTSTVKRDRSVKPSFSPQEYSSRSDLTSRVKLLPCVIIVWWSYQWGQIRPSSTERLEPTIHTASSGAIAVPNHIRYAVQQSSASAAQILTAAANATPKHHPSLRYDTLPLVDAPR